MTALRDSNALQAPTLLHYLLEQRRRFSRGVTLAILRCVVIAPCPWLFQLIIDEHVKTGSASGVAAISLIFVGLLFLHYAFSVAGNYAISRELADLIAGLRGEIFNKLHFLSFGYLDRERSGRLLAKYTLDTQKVETALHQILNQFLPNICYSLSITLILVALHWQLSVVVLLMIPILVLIRSLFHARLKETNESNRIAQERLTGHASEVITALKLVRSLGEERQVTERLEEHSAAFSRVRVELSALNSIFGTFTYASSQFLSLLVIAGGAWFVIDGSMTLGTLMAFMAGLPIITSPVQLFSVIGEQYFVGAASYRSIKELLDSSYVEEWRGTRKLGSLRGEIEFDRVTFAYPGAHRPVIRDLSLHIRPGEHIALVGHSGSGKSTLTYLLLGLYRPDSGEIRIDGVPQSELDMRWLRKQCAVVLQENLLLSGTVAENIRFAKPDATDEEVREAARLANASEFIEKMPDGYNTIVGERGVMVSGGQRQRLSIARAILRNPRILILDEATSALDYESERLVQEALERLGRGRTVITIAHRLSTIRNADRIVVLDKGRIIEQGTFEELRKKGGYFFDLLTAHALTAEEEPVA
ncbi:MAG: ABC transporter ATP-binding protein/permease [Kiritimatiellae bacterium]|nr:ABC transporter ATP-binding protein/permease [Kiritimatiellia bacterium]MDW8458062.1 ABC transporter ATP-binding protein [Verrucomicrobiota bacterium]